MVAILEVKDLYYNYPDGTEAIKGINFKVEEGQMISILGPNGAGKSTFFLHFNGIIEPTSGEIIIEGKTLKYDKKSLLEARAKVGVVFQNPDDQLFAPTVFEDVAFGPMNMGLDEEEVKQRVEEALEVVGMSEYAHKAPHHLSGGQKKRVAIAGILSMRPKVMVLDEPTSGLDPNGASAIMQLLYDLNADGMTIIVSTHDVDLVPMYSDNINVLRKGKILKQGNCREVFGDKEVIEQADLRLPWVGQIFEMLEEKDNITFSESNYPLTVADARKTLLEKL
ncbi:MAG: ATP-binding cassette domain-containing protein [Methanosphaera stadtmanae]|jgi:cobalt/nickel transport system ATP-binding protein|nr:ATP-binding cassette domain-containing protein [Methanosphaera stadtmanae]